MVYDLRCIYIGNEPSFALETKVRNVSNNINRSLIGNILKSIRVEKNIPMKKIASALKVSESTVSQIETGKNSVNIPWWRSHPIHENRATQSIWTEPCNPLLRATKSTKRATSIYEMTLIFYYLIFE